MNIVALAAAGIFMVTPLQRQPALPQITAPSDPLIANAETCTAQDDEFANLIKRIDGMRNVGHGDYLHKGYRVSRNCMQWWGGEPARFTCEVPPEALGATDAYYYLKLERDAAKDRCSARARQQQVLADLARDALQTDPDAGADRQRQSNINDRVRDAGGVALGNTVAGKAFDLSLAGIGLSNDRVLKELDEAFANIRTGTAAASHAEFAQLGSAIATAGQDATTRVVADRMLREWLAEAEALERTGTVEQLKTAADTPLAAGIREAAKVLELFVRNRRAALEKSEAKQHADIGRLRSAFSLGLQASKTGDSDRAIGKFKDALSLAPSCFECYYNLGVAQLVKKDARQAEASFLKALDLQADHVGSLNTLTTLYNNQKRYAEASAMIARALKVAGPARQPNAPLSPASVGSYNRTPVRDIFVGPPSPPGSVSMSCMGPTYNTGTLNWEHLPIDVYIEEVELMRRGYSAQRIDEIVGLIMKGLGSWHYQSIVRRVTDVQRSQVNVVFRNGAGNTIHDSIQGTFIRHAVILLDIQKLDSFGPPFTRRVGQWNVSDGSDHRIINAAAHEMGHVLGIVEHSQAPTSLMTEGPEQLFFESPQTIDRDALWRKYGGDCRNAVPTAAKATPSAPPSTTPGAGAATAPPASAGSTNPFLGRWQCEIDPGQASFQFNTFNFTVMRDGTVSWPSASGETRPDITASSIDFESRGYGSVDAVSLRGTAAQLKGRRTLTIPGIASESYRITCAPRR